jgi:protease-4
MVVLIVVGVLLAISWLLAGIASIFFTQADSIPMDGNVALIPVEGIILTGGSSSPFSESIASSTKIVEFIQKADENPQVKAILFEINSPGGSGVASEEIAHAIKKTNKTTVSFIREVGASGAYWVASATDQIYVNRMSITGSIGVIASYLEVSGLLKDYNVTYQRLVAGSLKDMGSPFKELTAEERDKLEEQLDIVHQFFIDEVAQNRRLSRSAVRTLATGEPILGIQARELGLVDGIGGKDEAISYIEKQHNITVEVAEYREKRTIFDVLSQVMGDSFYRMGLGIGRGVSWQADTPMVWT